MSSAAYAGASSACLAFVFLLFASVSPWIMYSSYVSYNGIFTSFGVGPFVAGASTAQFSYPPRTFYSGVVWWSDLSTETVCNNTSSIFKQWSSPHMLCPSGEFQIPTESQAIQACTVLATIFAFFAMLAGCGLGKSKAAGGTTATCCSFLGMIMAICSFSIWTTWSISKALQSDQGDYIPLYSSFVEGTDKTITVESSPVPVRLFYGWTFITTVLSFVLLFFSTLVFAGVSKRAHDDGEFGQFGSGIGQFGSGSGGVGV